MKLLYTSTSLAFTQLTRLTLDREGIAFFCSDADSSLAGIGAPMAGGQSRIYVHDDADFPRAVELMREIGAPAQRVARAQPAAKKHSVWLLAAIACIVIFSLGALISK